MRSNAWRVNHDIGRLSFFFKAMRLLCKTIEILNPRCAHRRTEVLCLCSSIEQNCCYASNITGRCYCCCCCCRCSYGRSCCFRRRRSRATYPSSPSSPPSYACPFFRSRLCCSGGFVEDNASSCCSLTLSMSSLSCSSRNLSLCKDSASMHALCSSSSSTLTW